ncbi:ankyrin repeat domain-containing protein [Nonomuraea longicatena]|uniref:Ankyrin repeat domain-containing protein n=1 Tax=Nonomuraea longicatena TaxID=83682 RepID=A0ABP4AGV8_9ACTN
MVTDAFADQLTRTDLRSWARVRRYAVPAWMIEQATERRLAGDWRGACAAAHVNAEIDLARAARELGAAEAGRLAEDLHHLVPDLLHWHLPRSLGGRSVLDPRRSVVLDAYGGQVLHAVTPHMVDGPQWVRLRLGPPGRRTQDWRTARYLWDARRTDELRERHGGRPPFFHLDGTPRPPTSHDEGVSLLLEHGRVETAFAASGVGLEPVDPRWLAALARFPLDLPRLGRELAALGETGDGFFVRWAGLIVHLRTEEGRPIARWEGYGFRLDLPELAAAHWRRLPDLDLLRHGYLGPGDLHPLVRRSLFPEWTGEPTGPPGPEPPRPVRVRCGREWHEVASRDGVLAVPHDEDEIRREPAPAAPGGPIGGCAAARRVWTQGPGWLPKGLRRQRAELFARVRHGDTPAVLWLLEAGVDPRVRDSRGRSLLHHVHLLDHPLLLPRLLAAGLDLEERDRAGRTPLHVAVGDGASEAAVRALTEAGARLDVVDEENMSLRDLIRRNRYAHLGFLADAVHRLDPDLGRANLPGFWVMDDV